MLVRGVRVVRGPDWSWGTQDGGEGFTGMVYEIGKIGIVNCPDKMVLVQWDNGVRSNYRVGYNGKFDLRVIDNAQLGIKHPHVNCDECLCIGIAGMRYKCSICYDYDLCDLCYHTDKHNTSHPFKRIDFAQGITVQSIGVDLPLRRSSRKCILKGISVIPKLVRGGGSYYPEHLPILGQYTEQMFVGHAVGPSWFNVANNVEQIKRVQQKHVGWKTCMPEYSGTFDTVQHVTDKGGTVVQYEDCDGPRTCKSVTWASDNLSNSQTNLVANELISAATQGELDTVKLLLDELPPGMVDVRSGGKTSLQVAAHRGHVDIVEEKLREIIYF